ncbi:MAG: chemotaxis protein CheW [Methanoregulaceae archaeon]
MAAKAQVSGDAFFTHDGSGSGDLQVVEFILGDELFAINLFDVKEVVEYTRITKLPSTPSHIKGIIDLRGEITTIIDLKIRMNISGNNEIPDENRRIIVLDDAILSTKLGIMVDDVTSVSTFSRDMVERTSSAVSNSAASYIEGIIRKKTREKEKERTDLVIWIDIRQMVSETDLGGMA